MGQLFSYPYLGVKDKVATQLRENKITYEEITHVHDAFITRLEQLTTELDRLVPPASIPALQGTVSSVRSHFGPDGLSWAGMIYDAIIVFQSENYEWINAGLREMKVEDVLSFLTARMLVYLITLSEPLPTSRRFLRGEAYASLEDFDLAFRRMDDGTVVRKSVMSTTYDTDVAFEFSRGTGKDFHVILVLDVPAGIRGVFLNFHSIESEFLLPPCTRWKQNDIQNFKTEKGTYVIVNLELVGVGNHVMTRHGLTLPTHQLRDPRKSRFINDLILYTTLRTLGTSDLGKLEVGHPLYDVVMEMKSGDVC